MPTKKAPTKVKAGQVYESTDKREQGRRFEVKKIHGTHAYGTTNRRGRSGKTDPDTHIAVSRLNPHHGWRLVTSTSEAVAVPKEPLPDTEPAPLAGVPAEAIAGIDVASDPAASER